MRLFCLCCIHIAFALFYCLLFNFNLNSLNLNLNCIGLESFSKCQNLLPFPLGPVQSLSPFLFSFPPSLPASPAQRPVTPLSRPSPLHLSPSSLSFIDARASPVSAFFLPCPGRTRAEAEFGRGTPPRATFPWPTRQGALVRPIKGARTPL